VSDEFKNSRALFARARQLIPGGVNSPVRAFKSVGADPVFIQSGEGATLTDVDGNRYIDYVGSWGPLIHGHKDAATRAAIDTALDHGWTFGAPTDNEVRLAQLICEFMPSIQLVRMVNSGTEATMSVIRLARAATGRDRIIKFAGCYHGHHDSLLVSAGSGLATLGTPSSPGVTAGTVNDTIVCKFNDIEDARAAFDTHGSHIAAVIVEPVAGNMGVVPPAAGFLEELRRLCDDHGALLIFDEVMTGFRVSRGGAQERFGVTPDLTTLGKIIGGGMPVGAYGGRADLMEQIAPAGPVYQAGTLSGNPVAMAAGIATLTQLQDRSAFATLESLGERLELGIQNALASLDVAHTTARVGSMFTLFFSADPIQNFDDALKCDTDKFASCFRSLLSRGIYLPASQFESWFISLAHTPAMIDATVEAVAEALTGTPHNS